jgi:hypothetical protein
MVDKEVMAICKERGVTYLRFSDDMILLASDRGAVAAAFDTYCSAVHRLKLPIHKPALLHPNKGTGKRSFWDAKTKGIYKWADPRETNGHPWIQFLGYQVRYDGAVRVRQSSIDKELSKLPRITGRREASLRPENVSNIRRSPSSIAHSFRMKLISMGVGRRKLGQPLDGPLPKCWAHGFRWLSVKNVTVNNLRALDRQRLTVRAAHRRTGTAAADFSRIRHADLGRFTVDRLMGIFNRLGSRVEVKVRVRRKLAGEPTRTTTFNRALIGA